MSNAAGRTGNSKREIELEGERAAVRDGSVEAEWLRDDDDGRVVVGFGVLDALGERDAVL